MLRQSLRLALLLVGLSLLTSCREEKPVFSSTPTARSIERIDSLHQVLTSAPEGWEMLYFPKTDSLLFADTRASLDQHKFPNQLGYGGFYFQLAFTPDGKASLRGDYTDGSAKQAQTISYSLTQGGMTRLSFTSGSYLTQLIGEDFEGELDFLFQGTDADGRLVFLSSKTIRPAQSYFLLRRVRTSDTSESRLKHAEENRKHFESMRNPQLTIRQGGRIHFRSDYITKYSSRGDLTSYGRNMVRQRYALFTNVQRKALVPDGPPRAIGGLGSGYVGTPDGLTFLSGIRLDSQRIFSDFVRQGDRYICELVRVYDPQWRTLRLVSRHLHPEGEETGLVAEIYDDPNLSYDYY